MIISEVKVNMNNLIKINKEKEREIDVFRKQLNVLNQRETQLELQLESVQSGDGQYQELNVKYQSLYKDFL